MFDRKLLTFAGVGIAGFAVDSAVLSGAMALGSGPWTGRLVSFSVAVTFTWYLNRRLTFADTDRRWLRQWARFLWVNGIGGAINLAVYSLLVAFAAPVTALPVLAVAAGSLAGFAWNYLGSRRLVFRGEAPAQTGL